jgi:hypothetical protein
VFYLEEQQMSDEDNHQDGMTRLSFIKASAGAAAGVAAIGTPGAIAAATGEAAVATKPSTPTPREPVVAYVRNAKRHEVTVVSGTREATYRDRALVRRLMKAAAHSHKHSHVKGGGKDVLAS